MNENDKPTKRFSSRVEDYVKYRPSYPAAVLACLIQECGLTDTAVVADVGAGTGLLSKLFLDFGNTVFGIEPNPEMRQAGERFLAQYDRFTSINGTAEATTLADGSVDFVVAGQAAHWFDAEPARAEFCRILKPGGTIALVWNSRKEDSSAFMRAYERILVEYGRNDSLRSVRVGGHKRDPDHIVGEGASLRSFANQQSFDFVGLLGRTLSSSMSPLAGEPNHEPMLAALKQLFADYEVNGRVTLLYSTDLYFNKIPE